MHTIKAISNKIHEQLFRRFIKIEKRIRFVVSALLVSLVLLLSTFFNFDKMWLFIPVLITCSYVLTYFAILEGIEKIEWIMLFLMPILLCVSSYLFYFLFPGRWLTRLPFFILFGVSYYATLLCSNIFNVGVKKSLALYRAAFSVNFLYQTIIAYLLFNNFFSFKINFLGNGLFVGTVTMILAVHLFWAIRLKLALERETLLFAGLVGLVMGELSIVLSFVPVTSSILALFLSASYYSLVGLIFHFIDNRLFKETVREYLIVLGFVLILMILTLSW